MKGYSFPRGPCAWQTCGNATSTRDSMVTMRQISILGDSSMSTAGWSQAQRTPTTTDTVRSDLGGAPASVNTWPMSSSV